METEQNYIPEEEINPQPKIKINKNKLSQFGLFFLLIFLVIILGYYSYYFFKNVNNVETNNNPTPPNKITAKPTPTIILTRLATDAAVLKIEKDIDDSEDRIKKLDLVEQQLTFPAIDFSLTF